jgi:hypothetical protein
VVTEIEVKTELKSGMSDLFDICILDASTALNCLGGTLKPKMNCAVLFSLLKVALLNEIYL